MIIRPATIGDAGAINEIYNPFILESAATFETEPWDEAQRASWIAARHRDGRYPVVTAWDDDTGQILGFASASPFDERTAYETSVKTSVFVNPASHGGGVGKRLYEALFRALEGEDVHRAYALIVAPNPASAALHTAFGFRHISTLDEVGRKFGRYYSVMWFEKRL